MYGVYMKIFGSKFIGVLVVTLIFTFQSDQVRGDEKLKPEEIIAKHLAALGTDKTLNETKSLVSRGEVKMVSRLGKSGNTTGEALLVSTNNKMYYGMGFPLTDYPGEEMLFDGAKPATGFLPLGKRSTLSLFFNAQEVILKEGLLGGVLSTRWSLLHTKETDPKLEYRGTKKIDDQEVHQLSYRTKKGMGDLRITLFFEFNTFRHIRTEYYYDAPPAMGSSYAQSSGQQKDIYKLTETFSDFRVENELMLPHTTRLELSIQTGRGNWLSDWTFNIKEFFRNVDLDDQLFKIK
jgi:hypothetical protein